MALSDRGGGLAADVGGTNVRFARVTSDESGRPVLSDERVLAGADFRDFESCLEAYLGGDRPARAVFGIAGSVGGGRIRLTNRDWSFSVEDLEQRFGLQSLEIINDFAAIAYAVPVLEADDWRPLPGPAWPAALPDRVSVIGPGTGLGVAMLVDGGARVVPTEAGHTTFAPADRDDLALLDHLLRTRDHVSRETLLSGRGIETLYQTLAAMDGRATPSRTAAEIVAAATGEDLARRTIERFADLLASALGDLALAQGAQAVVVAGGIPPRIAGHLETPRFRARFEARGPAAGDMARIPIALIARPEPGLLGAARRLVSSWAADL
ncbi:ROK family protein [Caulobacter mirabilis]|uniref:Glucokinase n=1 Tax=Caulobacter mirabilis TaxID=69666 RepID=A0A2D2AWM0_9CAUL|nr:ROK family protein [Caulobacter mirabilis]ATQ42410.1 glucokinase [Caulobacter mirabilis]